MATIGPLIGTGPLSSRSSSITPLMSSSMNSFPYANDLLPEYFIGVFLEPLYHVKQEVYPGFAIQKDALSYVEGLINQKLVEILNKHPRTISDVEQHILQCYPAPLDSWTVREAQENIVKKKLKDKHFYGCASKILSILKDKVGWKLDGDRWKEWKNVIIYVMAVLEYIAADILRLCGNYVNNMRHNEIGLQDLKVAMRADSVLMDMFFRDSDDVVPSPLMDDIIGHQRRMVGSGQGTAVSLTYEQTVKDLLHAETQYLRDLNIIVNVYRRAFCDIRGLSSVKVDAVFGNIVEIHELTVRFIGLLEDTMEMTRESCTPAVGSCFLETAEGAEYEVYERYAEDLVNIECQSECHEVLNSPIVYNALSTKGVGFILSVKYLLPKLLPIPISHFLQYMDFLHTLKKLSQDPDDQEDLRQAEGLLWTLKSQMEHSFYPAIRKKLASYITLRLAPVGQQHAGYAKLMEIQKQVEDWDARALNISSCGAFICEGDLGKVPSSGSSKIPSSILPPDGLWTKTNKLTERRCYLFETVFFLCKAYPRRSGTTIGGQPDQRLKEVIQVRKADLVDREDTDDLKNAFELRCKDGQGVVSVILVAKSAEEKSNWMAALIMLMMRSTLERMLDLYLDDEAKRVPLKIPGKQYYRFGENDSDENIVFEEYTSSSGVPVVRGATLLKLVERLTYYLYPDPRFVRTFLTTYRAFCSPNELLSLLVERFRVPDNAKAVMGEDVDETDPHVREILKKFRKSYLQPTQIRVLNVIRQWVDHHWYDFEGDTELLNELKAFLNDIRYPNPLIKWSSSLLKIIERKCDTKEEIKGFQFASDPPPIEWHLAQLLEQYDLMTLHPVEIARQVTLLEFDLYRAVKPIELVGAAWTKKDKDQRSPQLLKLIRHSTKFTYWLEKCILESGNIEERVAVMNRILEIMCVFQELNNFTGLIEIYCVFESSAVHRLDMTLSKLDRKLYKEFEKVKALLSDAHHKHIREKLRTIDPPCVPFFGMYLSNIIFLEEGNPVFLKMPLSNQANESDTAGGDVPNSVHEKSSLMISFTKCRKIAEIIGEIQMYQNQPYCLSIEPSIRLFFESLDPLINHPDKNEFEKVLFNRSLEIEPKECEKPPYFPPIRSYSLKSPGIETRQKKNLKHKGMLINPLTPSVASTRAMSTATAPSTAPSSPSAMSVVEINPGNAPRVIGDVGNHDFGDWHQKKSSSATIPRSNNQAQSSSLFMDDSAKKLEPPKIPPRTRVNSAASSLPPALKGHIFVFPSPPQESSTSNHISSTVFDNASTSNVQQETHSISSAATAGPPLPPRTPRTYNPNEPPPRPPKKAVTSSAASSSNASVNGPPPLPPKSYKKAT